MTGTRENAILKTSGTLIMKNNGASVSRVYIIKFDGRFGLSASRTEVNIWSFCRSMALISVFEDILCFVYCANIFKPRSLEGAGDGYEGGDGVEGSARFSSGKTKRGDRSRKNRRSRRTFGSFNISINFRTTKRINFYINDVVMGRKVLCEQKKNNSRTKGPNHRNQTNGKQN